MALLSIRFLQNAIGLRVVGMVLCKILDQYVSSYQRWIKSAIRLGNNEVLNTLAKTLTFKFYDLDLKVRVMSADGADEIFWPVFIMIPNRN